MINTTKFAIDYIFHFWGIVGTLATAIGMAYGLWLLLGVVYKWLYVNIHPFREISDCLTLIYFLPKIRLSFSRESLKHYIKNSTEQYRQNTFGRRLVFKAISKRLESMDAAEKKLNHEH